MPRILSLVSAAALALATDPYSADELNTIKSLFWANVDVSGTGAVVAAPSHTHPNYFYHWMRDGAISINVASEVLNNKTAMENYVNWVTTKTQPDSDPNNIDVRGEPKFFMDGKVFDGPWGRPQNDGPALRAIAMINYANYLIANGQKQKVTDELYFSDLSQNKGIKYDLEYVAHHWSDGSFCLWEEIMGDHFFTKMVQRKALLVGAKLAAALNDNQAASFYSQQASALEGPIKAHWDQATGVIQATTLPHGGPQKYLELDSAVHLGVIYGYNDDGFFAPNDEMVLSSLAKLKEVMYTDGMYPINAEDDVNGVPGLLVGRYPNDTYNGYETGKVGNPWILCTQALAEVQYRAATEIMKDAAEKKTEHLMVTKHSEQFFQGILIPRGYNGIVKAGELAHAAATALALVEDADSLLARVKYHIKGAGFHMSEQLNINNGYEQGANDLTWSYGTLFGALAARKEAIAHLV